MMRYITGETWDDAQRSKFLERQAAYLHDVGVCFGPVEHRLGEQVIGLAGMAPLEYVEDYQIGWWIDPDWQGKGLATEVARGLIRHAFEHVGLRRVLAVMYPENEASRKVAERAGMHFLEARKASELESRWADETCHIYVAMS